MVSFQICETGSIFHYSAALLLDSIWKGHLTLLPVKLEQYNQN